MLPLEMNACLPGCVWNATPRSRSALERNIGFWTQAYMRSIALQSLESNPQLSFATRMEDWTSLGQRKTHPEFPVVTRESRRNSRKTTWFPRHRKMKPFPATASQEKSQVRNWRSKRYLAPLMRPHKVPRHPGLPGEEHRGFPAPLPLSPFYPPDLNRRVNSPALSGRGSRPSGRTSG